MSLRRMVEVTGFGDDAPKFIDTETNTIFSCTCPIPPCALQDDDKARYTVTDPRCPIHGVTT